MFSGYSTQGKGILTLRHLGVMEKAFEWLGRGGGRVSRLPEAKQSDLCYHVPGARSCTGPQGTLSAGTTCATTKLESASTRQTRKATAPKTACTALLPMGLMTSVPRSTTSGALGARVSATGEDGEDRCAFSARCHAHSHFLSLLLGNSRPWRPYRMARAQ